MPWMQLETAVQAAVWARDAGDRAVHPSVGVAICSHKGGHCQAALRGGGWTLCCMPLYIPVQQNQEGGLSSAIGAAKPLRWLEALLFVIV